MSRKIIDIGLKGNDGTGDPMREAFRKINDNFQELYTSLGLVQGFTLLNLSDTPDSYEGQAGSLLAVNQSADQIIFKQLVAGNGITLDTNSNAGEIVVSSVFADIVADKSPQLGADLSASSGGDYFRIKDLGSTESPLVPIDNHEAVNKAYADTKISLAGIDAIEYTDVDGNGTPIGTVNQAYGIMTGPLILSRDPITEDDVLWDGQIAATKRYVDGASYFSRINLHVSTYGNDARSDIPDEKQGRALAYSYRTVEAACKKAEELLNEAPYELGLYAKVLTYNNNTEFCTLSSITTSVDSGIGCVAVPVMSVDAGSILLGGTGYKVGDTLTLVGGAGTRAATFEVVTINENTGAITEIKLSVSGAYTALPGSASIATTTNSTFGTNATVTVTYKLSAINITANGSGYGLASLRISGGGGSGAYGFVDISNGLIVSATVTASGSGYTSLPTITVDLPTFRIFTGGYGTDFTDVPGPSRDIREGLFLRGETSGAIANILAHSGTLDGDDELFDVDIISGTFQLGERIAYGDPVKNLNITIFVESGIYEENYPIKVPPNVSIKGDEFRRSIIRPKHGMSTSPYAFINFRRDTEIDGLTVTDRNFGYHYLTNTGEPVYPLINNKGGYRSAQYIIKSNKNFIKDEVVGWINAQIEAGNSPFSTDFVYNQTLCKRDVGLIVDALAYDLRWGGNARTISAALKYYQNASGLIAIQEQLLETTAAMQRISYLVKQCLDNIPPDATFTDTPQFIDAAYVAETNTKNIVNLLVDSIIDIVTSENSFNAPLDSTLMDVFLMNDATILRNITVQGHGGFAMVLDPDGQILTKSPYAQVGTVACGSINKQSFRGGLFIDGFAGNLQFRVINASTPFLLEVDNLVRRPQTPFSFLVDGKSYRVNYLRDFNYIPDNCHATFVLDETTPFTETVFEYNEEICSRDVALILGGVGYDMLFDSNYNARKSGLLYRQANAALVVSDQLAITLQGIDFAHDRAVVSVGSDTSAVTAINNHRNTILDIVENGAGAAPALVLTNPPGLNEFIDNAKSLLLLNTEYIKAEVTGWIDAQILASAPGFAGLTYDVAKCSRDIEYIVNAVAYDITYGGNSESYDAGQRYFDGVGDSVTPQLPSGQQDASVGAITYAKYVASQVVMDLAPATAYSAETRVTGPATNIDTLTNVEELFDIVIGVLSGDSSMAPLEQPDPLAYNYGENLIIARNNIINDTTDIQNRTLKFINNQLSYESITAGNRSMLSNDFTQINDMGYGLLATNGGLTEAVGMFTYYCYTAFYALNGGQIRSVGGSSANGVYALKAEGSDPLEVPTVVTLKENLSQGATVYSPIGTEYENQAGDLYIFVKDCSYVPYNQSEIEINHSGELATYTILSVQESSSFPPGVIKLTFSSAATSGVFDGSLRFVVPDGTKATIRVKSQILLLDVGADITSKPSTALVFEESPSIVYRVTNISTSSLPAGQAIITLRESYAYIDAPVYAAQPSGWGGIGNTSVAVGTISPASVPRLVGSQFGWLGTIHTITGYTSPETLGQVYGKIDFTPALVTALSGFSAPPTLKIGATAGLTGDITVKISTARFTAHDLLDIGTGSYADTNFPNVIYGDPAVAKSQENEVQEIGKGRVFYVTTDQNGNFRVGPYFNIDQSTGSVSFSANLALTGIDGLGFKRGVTVNEFSTDETLGDNATDTVPTEFAIRTYIDKRLGLTHGGSIVAAGQLIPLNTGGFLALSGDLPMKGDIDMDFTNRVIRMADPVDDHDAVTKQWTKLVNLQDGTLTGVADKDLVMLTGTNGDFVNVANNTSTITNTASTSAGGSDVTLTRSGNILTVKLVGGLGANNPITNHHVNNNADIAQSKLLMQLAGERSSAPIGTAKQKQATAGLASFKDTEFTVTDGFVELQTASSESNGIPLSKLQWVNGRSVVGNGLVGDGAASEVLMTDVVNFGGAIKKDQYTATGYLKRTGVSNSNDVDYTVVEDSSSNTVNTLVRRDGNGDFAARNVTVSSLYVDDKQILDTSVLTGTDTGVVRIYAYRGAGGILLGDGALSTDRVNYYDNELHKFRSLNGVTGGTVELKTLTTGNVATAGTLTGNWSLSTTSNLTLGTGTIDASLGTLKSLTLSTGSDGTAGVITGTWTVAGSGQLKLSAGGIIDATSGTLKSTSLSAGSAPTLASITGTWSLGTGSSLSPGNGTINASKADAVSIESINSASSTHYIAFTTAASNYQTIRADADLTYVPSTNTLYAGTFSGNFAGNITGNVSGNANTATKVVATAPVDSAANLVEGTMGTNDLFRIRVGGGSNAGWVELATADDSSEPIYVRQYTGSFATLTRTATLLDGSGNTSFPGTVTAPTFSGSLSGNASSANYATSAGSITSQANSATINATSSNTGNDIVRRDASGNFSAGTITATLSGTASNISNQANSATINATSANTANDIVRRDGSGNFSAGVMSGTATAARYADLAERYEADKEYKPGTVVVFGGSKEITQSTTFMDARVAGVISTNPAHLMNSEAGDNKTHPPVALQGRVPCRVIGKIQKGDMLVTSTIPGVAIAATDPKLGTVIGKSLENYDSDHIGMIEVVVGRA